MTLRTEGNDRASSAAAAPLPQGGTLWTAAGEATPPCARILALIAEAQSALDSDIPAARRRLDEVVAVILALRGTAAERGPQTAAVPQTAAPQRGGLAAWQMRRIVAHVEAHLAARIAVAALALAVGLRPGHFSRAFKVSFGETPHRFVIRRRLLRAQHLLLTTTAGISQIAVEVGLTDQAHLTRLFRQFLNDTPHAWRRAMQESRATGPERISA